jgi:hypothetical protein
MACAFACNYFLLGGGGDHKSKAVISKPITIEELKQRMKEETAAIPEQMTGRVIENLRERLEQCLRNDGRHLNDEIFKNENGMY